MAATLFEPTDVIEVSFVPILIYGGPGVGKTTLAQTAAHPLTLDFDRGIHRCANRKRAMRFDTWSDCVKAGEDGKFAEYQTLVIDTGGRALDSMIPGILAEDAKNGYQGNLSPKGWGIMGTRFTTWMKLVASWGKDVVFLCHQEEVRSNSGETSFVPDLPGKMAWKEVHKSFDLIGRIRHDGKRRILDFDPSDTQVGKNAAGFDPINLPDLHKDPTFLSVLLARAKERIGKTAEASALVSKAALEWEKRIDGLTELPAFNAAFKEYLGLPAGVLRVQVRHLFKTAADAAGWKFDQKTGEFIKNGGEG